MRSLAPHPWVRLSDVVIARGGRRVLARVSLEVGRGEAVHVAGANGSGKTSLLRVLGGAAGVREGRLERQTGRWALVPERLALTPDVVAVEWARGLRRLRGGPALPLADLEAAGLSALSLRQPARQLSKGQLQRVALAEAVGAGVDLLVLDEPWAGLDALGRDWLAERLVHGQTAGAGVVFSDHSGARGSAFSPDRVLLVADATVVSAVPVAVTPTWVRLRHCDPHGDEHDELVERAVSDDRLRVLLSAGHTIEEVSRA